MFVAVSGLSAAVWIVAPSCVVQEKFTVRVGICRIRIRSVGKWMLIVSVMNLVLVGLILFGGLNPRVSVSSLITLSIVGLGVVCVPFSKAV